MTHHLHRRLRDDAGFTLLEIMVVVGLIGVLATMAILVSPAFTRAARADASLTQVVDVLRSAREVAINERRNVRLRFILPNGIQTVREDINSTGTFTGTTVLRTVELENRLEIRLDPDADIDTPDGFGRTTATTFSSGEPWRFTSEGTFVGPTGDPINGTVFLSIPNEVNSARAITIMGATALIRPWKWNGREWVE